MNDMTQNTEKIKAVLRCVVRPDEKQTNGFVSFLKREYQTDDVELDIVEDPKIWGGFILEVGSEEYDWSLRGRENQIGQRIDHACEKAGTAVSQDKIISILRAAAEDFKVTAEKREVGFVETAGDGIVTVTCANEIVSVEVSGGFASVDSDFITVVADRATVASQ